MPARAGMEMECLFGLAYCLIGAGNSSKVGFGHGWVVWEESVGGGTKATRETSVETHSFPAFCSVDQRARAGRCACDKGPAKWLETDEGKSA